MLDKHAIMDILPHRPPMLLIDEVVELEPGRRAVALKHLSGDEDFFRGHFPGQPVMPGVLTIEALAQAGAVAVLSLPEFKGKTGFLAGIGNARFKRKIFPGETIRLEVELTKMRGPIGIGNAVATVAGELAASAELKFAIG